MVQKPKAVTYKVIAGYLLLFATAVLSVWFVYSEILKIARPAQNTEDNNKIIRISNTIAVLYASEATGRTAILTGAAKDMALYTKLTDSINSEINAIKKTVEPAQAQKFDSVQLLLARKKNSIAGITNYRKKYAGENTFTKAIDGVYEAKDSVWHSKKPISITKPYQWRKVVNALLTPKQLDSLSKLPLSNDSLVMAFDKVLNNLVIKDNRLRRQLNRREQKLLEENRIISDQLRAILASVENEFIQKSYASINASQASLANTIKIMAWVGAVTLFFLLVFAYIIIRDLASNQNYRKQLEALNLENEELLRSKSMLMATVTHDLQTPLGSIIGFHDLIKKLGVTPKQSHYLANIKESANYILKLVNDLLDFSKLENNRISIEKTNFNIKSVIEATCRSLEPMAFDKNIELNWDVEDELDANFVSDPYRIKQILTNLISNAIKFTHEGSVEVIAKTEGGAILISVLDTGIGIAPQNHDAVFKEFTQAHSGIEKKFGGTGLGLTISKKIAELLGGTIILESTEGQGSIFTISLPCIPALNKTADALTPPKQHWHELLNGKKILAVDDDNVQLKLMKELLSHYALTIITEINSASALQLIETEHFDVVLTDIQMPILDGFELVKQIRQHPDAAIAALPVIALSGKRDLGTAQYTSRGFTAYHPKPLQLEELLSLISAIISSGAITSYKEQQTTAAGVLYNLGSLSQYTHNDPDALKTILDIFIESATDNCEALQEASIAGNDEMIAQVAHKMIPMLRQMEVYSIANLLLPLEEKTLTLTGGELQEYVNTICSKMAVLCNKLEGEIA